jgi:hypothetical protein
MTTPQWARSHHYRGFTITHKHTGAVELLWTSDQPVAETSTWQHNTYKRHLPPVGFEPAIPAGKHSQTHTLDLAVNVIGT